MRTSQSGNPRCAYGRGSRAGVEDAPTRRVSSGDARSRHMLLNDITLWHVARWGLHVPCGGQSYVTLGSTSVDPKVRPTGVFGGLHVWGQRYVALGSTRVVTKAGPKSVGVYTCSAQSYVTLPPASYLSYLYPQHTRSQIPGSPSPSAAVSSPRRAAEDPASRLDSTRSQGLRASDARSAHRSARTDRP